MRTLIFCSWGGCNATARRFFSQKVTCIYAADISTTNVFDYEWPPKMFRKIDPSLSCNSFWSWSSSVIDFCTFGNSASGHTQAEFLICGWRHVTILTKNCLFFIYWQIDHNIVLLTPLFSHTFLLLIVHVGMYVHCVCQNTGNVIIRNGIADTLILTYYLSPGFSFRREESSSLAKSRRLLENFCFVGQ
jgi:hypothetical protein